MPNDGAVFFHDSQRIRQDLPEFGVRGLPVQIRQIAGKPFNRVQSLDGEAALLQFRFQLIRQMKTGGRKIVLSFGAL